MSSKRQRFIDLAKAGGKRQNFIDLAVELDLADPKYSTEGKKMPSEKSYDRKTKRTGKKHGGLIKGQPKLTKKGWK